MVNEDQVAEGVCSEAADTAASRTSMLSLAVLALFNYQVVLVIDVLGKLER